MGALGCLSVALSAGLLAAPYTPYYAVEVTQGPVVGAANILGMGGAYIGIAEDSGGQIFNPAAVANRNGYNGGSYFDWDFSLDGQSQGAAGALAVALVPSALGFSRVHSTVVGNGTFGVWLGRLGLGVAFTTSDYDFCAGEDCRGDAVTGYSADGLSLQGGWNYLDGSLVVAVGAGLTTSTFNVPGDQAVTFGGGQYTLGALYRPTDQPWRLGMVLRSAVQLGDAEIPPPSTAAVQLPVHVHQPWQIGAGFAWGFGSRRLNPPSTFGDEGYVLQPPPAAWWSDARVDLDVIVEGASTAAVSLAAWAGQVLVRAGRTPTVSVRLGVESEFWPHRLRGRVGTYFEPARSDGVRGRPHGTAGFDLRLGRLVWEWRFGAAADLAPGYLNTALSLGFWH